MSIFTKNYIFAKMNVIFMKKNLLFIIAGLLCVLLFSCSKSDSGIPNVNKNEFGSITPFDSIVAAIYLGEYYFTTSDNGKIDSVYYPGSTSSYYFKYNSNGLPVLKFGGFAQLPTSAGYGVSFYNSAYKDTLIYLNNHTIEMRTFPFGNSTDSYTKTLFTFSNGYLSQKISGIDTTTFNYNNSHQLISVYTGTIETQYVYTTDSIVIYTYYFDPVTKERSSNNNISISYYYLTEKNANPYYKQEWLKMWPEFIDRTISPYSTTFF
jgi:hypothetical protein